MSVSCRSHRYDFQISCVLLILFGVKESQWPWSSIVHGCQGSWPLETSTPPPPLLPHHQQATVWPDTWPWQKSGFFHDTVLSLIQTTSRRTIILSHSFSRRFPSFLSPPPSVLRSRPWRLPPVCPEIPSFWKSPTPRILSHYPWFFTFIASVTRAIDQLLFCLNSWPFLKRFLS